MVACRQNRRSIQLTSIAARGRVIACVVERIVVLFPKPPVRPVLVEGAFNALRPVELDDELVLLFEVFA